MDTSRQVSDGMTSKSELLGAAQRQRRSIAEKRRIVEETLVEGVSVARVAQAHGINANQVFGWRRLAVVGIFLEHRPVRIGLLVARVRASDVIHIAYGNRRIGSTVVDVQGFE
jgi:transposase-like protein